MQSVTLSLETYEDMKKELERLRKENAEKTIVVTEPHWVNKALGLGILFAALLTFIVIAS